LNGDTFDGMGRATTLGSRNLVWNLASRLVSHSLDGKVTTATYDGLGLRLSRTIADATTNYVWSYAFAVPSIIIEKQDSTDSLYYIRMPGGELLYSIDANTNTRSFYHFDELGNTLFVSNDAGATIASYAYSPYGILISSTGGLDNPFTWQGEFGVMAEGGGMYYMRARYYDANAGRFISRDPIESIDPKTINPYQYAMANPLKYHDVSGTMPTPTGASEAGAVTNAALGTALKSTGSQLTAGVAGGIGDSINLGIHLQEGNTEAAKDDALMLTVDVGGIYLTWAASAAEAGALTGSSIAGPAVLIYAFARLGIVVYESWWDLQAAEQRLEATIFAGKLNKKKQARRQAEEQARINKEIQDRQDASLQREQALRDKIKSEEDAIKKDAEAGKDALQWLAKLLSGG